MAQAGLRRGTGPPQATWHGGPQRWTLRLAGDWRAPRAPRATDADADTTADLPQRLASAVPLPSPLVAGALAVFDGQALAGWNSALAARLWTLTETLRPLGAQVPLDRLPAGLREVLALAAPPASGTTGGQTSGQTDRRTDPQADRQTTGLANNGAGSAAFLGDVLIAVGRWLRAAAPCARPTCCSNSTWPARARCRSSA